MSITDRMLNVTHDIIILISFLADVLLFQVLLQFISLSSFPFIIKTIIFLSSIVYK